MDESTKAITLAATSKNLKTQQSRRIYHAVCKVKTRRLCFVLMCCVQCTECFFSFFQALLKSIACDQFRVAPRLDGPMQDKKKVRRPIFETKVFPEHMLCTEEVLATLLGLFDAPSDSAPSGFAPLATPLDQLHLSIVDC